MAFTGIAALASAAGTGAAITATMVLTAVAEVGLALSVVGAVTGNKSLMKIGGAMSLIGGIGGAIAGAAGGATSAATGAAVESGLGATATEAALEAASTEAMGAFGGSAAAEAATLDVVAGMEGAAGLGAQAPTQGIVGNAMRPAGELTPGTMATQPVAQPSGPSLGAPEVISPTAPQGPIGAQAPVTPADRPLVGVAPPPNPNVAPETSGSFFGKMSTWAEQNKTMFSTGVKLIGNTMQGANERDMWNRKIAIEQQLADQKKYGNQVARFQPRPIFQGAMQ